MTDEVTDDGCLVLFCKRPALFQGKQRLATTIGAEQALEFAQSFLACALEDLTAWPGPVILSPSTPEDASWAATILSRDHDIIAQTGGSLGDRLQQVDQAARQLGHEKVIFIGSDHPALSAQHYREAREALQNNDVVLSPARDGGVTIMGAGCVWPDLTGLPWSTEQLGRALSNHCRDHGLEVSYISSSYDIDVAADLAPLCHDLKMDYRPARQALYHQLCDFLMQETTAHG